MSIIFSARLWRSMAPTPRATSGASTFSSTVSQGNSAKLWKTMETFGICPSICLPCQSTWPDEGFDRPVSMRSSVDLPEPEGPSKPTILPGDTARSVGRNHLDAIAVRLRIVLLNRAGLNDGFGQTFSPRYPV